MRLLMMGIKSDFHAISRLKAPPAAGQVRHAGQLGACSVKTFRFDDQRYTARPPAPTPTLFNLPLTLRCGTI